QPWVRHLAASYAGHFIRLLTAIPILTAACSACGGSPSLQLDSTDATAGTALHISLANYMNAISTQIAIRPPQPRQHNGQRFIRPSLRPGTIGRDDAEQRLCEGVQNLLPRCIR